VGEGPESSPYIVNNEGKGAGALAGRSPGRTATPGLPCVLVHLGEPLLLGGWRALLIS